MKTKFNGILTLLLAFVVQISFAQEKTISGTVSESSDVLPGVSVVIKGTTKGVETDFGGKYTIKAKTGDILVFRYLGYNITEKTVGTSNIINVKLSIDENNTLDEIIVVGYGTSTKKSFTGTATVVDSENIDAKAVSNVAQALIGEVAGVVVTRTDGRPGASATIRIRGFNSIEGNSSPLYVVDGVPFNGDINAINPNDIESTVILKSASATAIYGARGANGVVLLTTRKGTVGKNTVEFDFQSSVSSRSLPRYNLVNNEEQYMELVYAGLKNTAEFAGNANPSQFALDNLFSDRGVAPLYNMWNVADGNGLIDPNTGRAISGVTRKYTPTDWKDVGYRDGVRNEMNFKTSGGTAKTKHYFSLGYLSDEGYIAESQYDRYSTRLNVTSNPIDRVKISTNLDYSYSEYNDATGYGGGDVTYMLEYTPTIYPLYLRDTEGAVVNNPNTGKPFYDFGDNTAGNARGFSPTYNGVGEAIYNINRTKRHSVNGNIKLAVEILEGLTFETTYGMNYYSSNLDRTRNSIQGSSGVALGGTIYKLNRTYVAQNFNQILRYQFKLGGDHNLDMLVAHESTVDHNEYFDLSKKGIVNLNPNAAGVPDNYLDQNGVSFGNIVETAIEGYFTQANYNFAQKYYLSGTLRRDGSSRFYKNKWGTFGSVGAGWIASEEAFLSSSKVINFLKFKADYGILGDQGNEAYQGQLGFNIENLLGQPSLAPRAVVDPDITWESSKRIQVGAQIELFNGRIKADVDYFLNTTNNLYVQKRLPPSTGDAVILTNDGALENRGIEFNVTGNIVRNKDFNLSLTINGALLDNTLTEMPIENATGLPKVVNIDGRFALSEGSSRYDYYLREWAGVDPANGNPMWTEHWSDENDNGQYDSGEGIPDMLIFVDANPDEVIQERLTNTYSDATRKYVDKSAIPTIAGAFRLNTSYKSFSLSTQFSYALGGYGYDAQYANLMDNGKVGDNSYHTDMTDRWMQPGDISAVPRLYSNENVQVTSSSTRFLQSSDYLALNNFRLGYKVASKFLEKTGFSSVNLWLSGDNLFLLSTRDGYNPTTSLTGESGRYTYNPITSYTVGVRVKF
ncbi:MAG: TonB-linked SusC/RagA family outer membrane protein [Polaribacter sp.]|jgi:TonB-linked SusC/RagA family outer membrane protein